METKTIEVSSFSISLDSFPDEICKKIQSYRNRKEGWHYGEEIEYIESTTIHEAKERLYQGLKRLCNSQESSKRNLSITTSEDLKVWQSETLPSLFQLSA